MTKRLLLCDDEPHILRAAEIKFVRAGFAVECADDGEQGWQKLCAAPVDLVITDCQMPRLNGLELVARIRADGRFDELPIIMLTAKGFELSKGEIRDRFRVLDVVAKPFSPRELLRMVEHALGATAA